MINAREERFYYVRSLVDRLPCKILEVERSGRCGMRVRLGPSNVNGLNCWVDLEFDEAIVDVTTVMGERRREFIDQVGADDFKEIAAEYLAFASEWLESCC